MRISAAVPPTYPIAARRSPEASRGIPVSRVPVARSARADSIVYDIQDLMFAIPAGENGWPSAITISEPGTVGHLLWTYSAGDFAGGTGTLLDTPGGRWTRRLVRVD